jgi:Domain of unknown function (DUF1772)
MMKARQKLFTIFLWLSVINLSIWIGGTMFHMIVVLPIWSQPLPGSVKDFFGGTRAYEYLLDFYGPMWMIIRILPIIICLLLGWNYKRHRYFFLITVLTIALGMILSVVVVFPINDAIMAKAGDGKSTDEIQRMVHTWIQADRLRFAVIFVGYFFLLWAFRLPIPLSKANPDNTLGKT